METLAKRRRKLLDFGIAKLMPGRDVESTVLMTRTGLRLMTPEYASPEQIRGEAVGAATDVYALGVVLYELLTGQLPYRLRSRIFHEIVRVICEEPPTRPSTAGESGDVDQISRVRRTSPADLRKRLSGDLDGIVLKALEKQPYDRYRSASSLSDDIEQHLEGRPVVARQATFGYRAGKFLRRNLPWMILLAALAAALATGGIIINRTGAAVIGGCMAAVGLWYAATNRELGRRIAESESPLTRDRIRHYAFGLLWAVSSLWYWPRPRFWLGGTASLIFGTLAIRQAVGWAGRRRAAGGLVLDLTYAISPLWPLSSLATAALLVFTDIRGLYYSLSLLWLGIFIFLEERLEIRARGIVYAGTLYSWERIELHEWSGYRMSSWLNFWLHGTSGQIKKRWMSKSWLKLRLRGGIQFLPPVQIPIPPAAELRSTPSCHATFPSGRLDGGHFGQQASIHIRSVVRCRDESCGGPSPCRQFAKCGRPLAAELHSGRRGPRSLCRTRRC